MPARLRRLAVPLVVGTPLAAQEANRNVRLGMPSPAKSEPASREAFLIERPQYVLSYNAKTRTANWVSWSLRQSDIGNAASAAFEPDRSCPRASPR